MAATAIVWLRRDLRVSDNPALMAALDTGLPVVALYIHPTDKALRPIGGASRWWLHGSLGALGEGLKRIGIGLDITQGDTSGEINAAIERHSATSVFWNRRYGPTERDLDGDIKTGLRQRGLTCESFAGNALVEPWGVLTKDDKPYSVYTPFWKALRDKPIAPPLPAPERRRPAHLPTIHEDGYRQPKWSRKLASHWQPGEIAAQEALTSFLEDRLSHYPEDRDRPARDATSRLSPHLAFGEISARQIWHAAQTYAHRHPARADAIEKFLSELAWRDFNHHQLYHRDNIAEVPMQSRFTDIRWRKDGASLTRWQKGQTGIPIVDAGMRELWETGYMHNRVRMLVGSLLVKNMLIDWHLGEQWFWDCLVDADEANNPGNWQWVAGCGLDASPYFRIFNPETQGHRFDADGAYVRRWVPELRKLPDDWIHRPGAAPAGVLEAAGVALGRDYPEPIVDLKATRQRALDAFRQ